MFDIHVAQSKHDIHVSLKVSSTYIVMGRYNHFSSFDATTMVSKTAQPLVNTLLPFS